MSYNNHDIAACGHGTCPSRRSCLRWVIGQRMEDYQAFGEFKPDKGKTCCKYYTWTRERAGNESVD